MTGKPTHDNPPQAGSEAWRLDGRTALVTGASRGIGRAIAQEFARLGANLVLVARGQSALDEVADEIHRAHPETRVRRVAADVATTSGRDDVVSGCDEGLDILVNNTGTNIRARLEELSFEDYRHVQRVNIESAFELCRLLYSVLKKSSSACVVNNASVAGFCHLRTGAAYGMSKAAMIQMTRNLAVEWAPEGIRVNAIAPWYVRTPLAEQVLQDAAYREEVLGRTPLGRLGEPEDCARAAAFLCMPAAAWITGQCLAVDGGFSVYGF